MSTKAWAEEDELELIEMYAKQTQDVHYIGEYFGKGYRSVISKLVQLRIYKKPEPDTSKKNKTVKVMLRDLQRMLGIEIEGTNLNKKENLNDLVIAVTKLYGERCACDK